MKKLVNLTPHAVTLNDGTVFPPSGVIARVSNSYTEFDEDHIGQVVFGEIMNLPDPEEGTLYIVSGLMAAAAAKKGRTDLVSPATGHPATVRDDQGRIVSVPGLVRP